MGSLWSGNSIVDRHGIRQMRTAWSDGPEFVTQCPIRPGGSYTYRFTIQGQEGTLWWHAHSSWLRATVYGGLIIRPKEGDSYPFPKPKRESLLLLGNDLDYISNSVDRNKSFTITACIQKVHEGMVLVLPLCTLFCCHVSLFILSFFTKNIYRIVF